MSSTGKISMSLDDIIKQQKTTRKDKKSNLDKRPYKNKNLGYKRFENNNNFKQNAPGVNRRLRRRNALKRTSFSGNSDIKRVGLSHKGREQDQNKQRQKSSFPIKKCRLRISNLSGDVTNKELYEIFSEIGKLKRCGIHWDPLGKSIGTADIEFYNNEDATKAIKSYDNAECQGKKLRVEYRDDVVSSQFTERDGVKRRRIKTIISYKRTRERFGRYD